MVGPVCVDDPDLRDRRITLFRIPEICLQEFKIGFIHCQTQFLPEIFPAVFIELREAFHDHRHVRLRITHQDRRRLFKRSFPGFDRVDQCFPDLPLILTCKFSPDVVDPRASDIASFPSCGELDALGAGIRPLVKLTGEVFHRQHPFILCGSGRFLFIEVVDLGLGKDRMQGCPVDLFTDILQIIAVQDPDAFSLRAQHGLQIIENTCSLRRVRGFLFHKTTINCHFIPFTFCRYPCGNAYF